MSSGDKEFSWADGLTIKEYVKERCDAIERKLGEIDDEVRSLQITRALLAGKASHTSVIIAYVLAGIGLLLSLLGYLRSLTNGCG